VKSHAKSGVVVNAVSASAFTSVVDTQLTPTTSAVGFTPRFELNVYVVCAAMIAEVAEIVRTFPTAAAVAVCEVPPTAVVTAALAAKMALLNVHVIVSAEANAVVCVSVSTEDVGVAPPTRVLGTISGAVPVIVDEDVGVGTQYDCAVSHVVPAPQSAELKGQTVAAFSPEATQQQRRPCEPIDASQVDDASAL
jgi:hypothetical protein